MPRPCRILVAEDNSLVLMSLEGLIEDMGWEMIGPAMTLSAAEQAARSCEADIALLDVNLAAERSFPVADILVERGIPILFVTGHDGSRILPERLADTPIIMKPYSVDELEERLRELVAGTDEDAS